MAVHGDLFNYSGRSGAYQEEMVLRDQKGRSEIWSSFSWLHSMFF